MIVDVFSEYDGDILFPARESLSTSDSTGTHGLCDPVEFGNLIQTNIDSREIVLEWSTFLFSQDLRTLRRALDEAGCQDVLLPPQENHIALVHLFRRHLGRTTPLHLPVLFCSTHPGHPLLGAFHSSDVDVQATRLMVFYLLELLKRPSPRSVDNVAVSATLEISRGQRVACYQNPTSEIELGQYAADRVKPWNIVELESMVK